ncbi:MAG: tRNA uridine-5-carboxymethylaminomethyl(34) synthesis GTPase MnmE [Lachnospiraceae bacterium]|nr:tRNA uridine-5-carboxymethylaminomethyl(34) synthesis GTPase MnmE [Lachnospiraceae bacterium]
MRTDTIAAIATAMSNSGIGIIRVSGGESIKIVDSIYRDKNHKKVLMNFKSNTIHYGFIFDGEEIVDEVMVSVMKKPNSFTTEDTVEINCHGGILIMNRILEIVIKNGARMADPGEFTKRAFLNGRIDLSEAEAVMDIISSENDMALKNSIKQLRGSVSDKIRNIRSEIIYEIAFIESALDDPEHINIEGYSEKLEIKVDNLIKDVSKLLSTAENGKIIREGINTVIIGKPNAGKSSLLNILAGEEKAIVTNIAGTTRDILEENIRLHGISLHVIDTAGIRSTEDLIEKIGVEKAKKYTKEADLIIYVVDSSVPMDENDIEIINMIQDKKCIVLFNKSDLKSKISFNELENKFDNNVIIIKTSTKENTGIEEFENAVKELFFHGEIVTDNEIMITNLRHKEALQEALDSLNQVKRSIEADMPEDFYSIDLMSAYSSLGKIIGEEVEEDLVNEIFSKFCMGK